MSKRRDFGDVVQMDDEDGPYHARILAPDRGQGYEECWLKDATNCTDPDCREWWTLEVLDESMNPTGEYVYHIAECAMRDATTSPSDAQERTQGPALLGGCDGH